MDKILSALVLSLLLGSTSVRAAGSDELWEITTRMDMPGMPMPEVTQTVCTPKGAGYTPGKVPHQKHCETIDLKVSGNKTSWKVHCSGRNGMDGSGEVIRTAGTMEGSMKLSSKDMEMAQVISGKRVGTCQAK